MLNRKKLKDFLFIYKNLKKHINFTKDGKDENKERPLGEDDTNARDEHALYLDSMKKTLGLSEEDIQKIDDLVKNGKEIDESEFKLNSLENIKKEYEKKFQEYKDWLKELEEKGSFPTHSSNWKTLQEKTAELKGLLDVMGDEKAKKSFAELGKYTSYEKILDFKNKINQYQ